MATTANPSNATSLDGNSTSSILEKVLAQSAVEGIGGKGGYVYDVNSLKRNLLQETLKAYKVELFQLLNAPQSTEQDIVEKLSALVEGSPVRTTTDSNLLDGTWALAYTSKHTTIRNLRDFSNYYRRKKGKSSAATTPAMRRIQGKGSLFKSVEKSFYLEHLEDDEQPYVVECIRYFGGLFTRERRFIVEALTRQTLQLRPVAEKSYFWGRSFVQERDTVDKPAIELHIIYVDVNLYISSIKDDKSQSYEVFTKDEAWLDIRRSAERKMSFTTALFVGLFTRFLPWWNPKKPLDLGVDHIISEIYADSAHLRVLKLGNTLNVDEEAWDSVSDPFIHLSADERQKILKAMSLGQIEKAGIQGKSKYRRNRWKPNLFNRRKTFFKQPREKQS